MLIDTHMHLNDPKLKVKIDEVINDAKKQNVLKLFVVGYDLESSKQALEIAHKYEECYAIIGFHPTEIKEYGEKEYLWLEEHAKDSKVVAIGEIGYDFHWDTTTKEEQQIAFERQIAIAKQYHLPVSIHSRDAIELTYQTLLNNHIEEIGGVLHSYSGSKEMADKFVKLNLRLGISGPVTFKNGRVMKEVVEEVDLQYLLSETDSPYLTPHPFRGQENGPKFIPYIVKEIAKIKNVDFEVVEKQIENNVLKLFGV